MGGEAFRQGRDLIEQRENLDRLSEALATQTVLPRVWLVVDTGSDDGSLEYVQVLAAERDWELIFAMFHRQIPPHTR